MLIDTATTSEVLNQGMQKSGAEFYAFLIVVLIFAIVLMVLWFRSREKLKAPTSTSTSEAPGLTQSATIPTCNDCPQTENLKREFIHELKMFEIRMAVRMDALKERVELNEEREEGRLAAFERKLEDNFRDVHESIRSVHQRIDIHLQAHGSTHS